MNTILERQDMPLYLRVYTYYKKLILNGTLKKDSRLPSIRKAAEQFQMSRTTMENAYLLLAAEGYILAKPQSGYYVCDVAKRVPDKREQHVQKGTSYPNVPMYDFLSSSVDRDSFPFDVWRRYMKSALRQDERLAGYGEPQGETEFREVLCEYLQKTRGVVCVPEQIVIGAGVQSLLYLLCPLLERRGSVAFANPDFVQGRAVFEDYGYRIADNMNREDVGIFYLSPSQMQKWGGILTVAERMELIREADQRNILLIEDDYNSEFAYFQKQAPSLQGLAGGDGVIYLGTFSKMLLPSIRMSYMILPPEFLSAYQNRRDRYNQTASKAEQIALTQFIRDGHLAGQIRKSRKIHLAKARRLADVLNESLCGAGKAYVGESGLQVFVTVRTVLTPEVLRARLLQQGVTLLIHDKGEGELFFVLNCASVLPERYEAAAAIIRKCLETEV